MGSDMRRLHLIKFFDLFALIVVFPSNGLQPRKHVMMDFYSVLQRPTFSSCTICLRTEYFSRLLILSSRPASDFQLDAVPKGEASVQQRMELQKEVDALKVSFGKQVGTQCVGEHNIVSSCNVFDWGSPLTNLSA